ncbi:hypothetical protein [Corallococcus macrosporus]|uniref:Lipoprotein n=1 Tax=Corallococcus macrosporus DSM 14697 TaxID=1189310 RepID=A0A250K3W4_9BACT|nr:hypothetical protein [Corallococcus macrosporus]ATB50590.1 hypothetical protein MYMAC_006246 [Corallococcus macrosporus DSM 14697]
MHPNKRFAWAWVAAGVFAVSGLVVGCDPEEDPTPTPDAGQQNPDSGTRLDSGTQTDSGTPPPDAGTEPDDAGTEPEDAGTEPEDAGTEEDAGTPPPTLPLAVDGAWIPSGYMGDGASGGVTYSGTECASRAGSAQGACHRFTWTPGGEGWAGVFWQFPEGNWGSMPGFAVPDGANSVSFYAWGAEGGEVVTFMTGMNAADGFEVPLENVALTTTPTQYTIDISRVRYGLVVGGFGWSAGGGRTTPLVFFIDDIHWH